MQLPGAESHLKRFRKTWRKLVPVPLDWFCYVFLNEKNSLQYKKTSIAYNRSKTKCFDKLGSYKQAIWQTST